MIKIETSDHSETISNRFLMSKLIYKIVFDRFGTFSISDSFSGRDSFFGTRVKFAADTEVHFYIYIDGYVVFLIRYSEEDGTNVRRNVRI